MTLNCIKSITLLIALFALVHSSIEAKTQRPNIVFLLTDDQTTYSLGCYGNSDVKTPHIDSLAEKGMVFDNHYVTTAICMASRANIMTGLYEYRNGCNFTHGPLLRATWEKSYPMLLRKAGYRTAMAGKIGFVVSEKPKGKGKLPQGDFDVWGAGPGQTSYVTKKNASIAHYAKDYPHATLAYGAFGRDFITESAKRDKPFCLSINFKAPHRPTDPDPRFNDVYKNVSFTKPQNYGRDNGKHFSKQSRQGRQYERFHSWNYSDKYNEVMAIYHQQIYAVDQAVGMIVKALKESQQTENTIVIFTSDNGFFCGSHGYGSKVLPYEESSRVPLIIYDPRHSNSGKGIRCQSLTGNIDFAPTFLSLAKVPIPPGIDGKNLMVLYDDPKKEIHSHLSLINVWGPSATYSLSVVTSKQKYIYWPYANEGFEATEELYDLENDPLELKELSKLKEHRASLNKLRKVYDQAVAHWVKYSVPYHRYKEYGTFFDRNISWEKKSARRKARR